MYDSEYYKSSPVDDPVCSAEATPRVFRGGSWDDVPRACRSANRGWVGPGTGSASWAFAWPEASPSAEPSSL